MAATLRTLDAFLAKSRLGAKTPLVNAVADLMKERRLIDECINLSEWET
jgi:hypothetical protein